MDYGIETATTFTSKYPVLKATVSGLIRTGIGIKTIPHNLGYRPAFLVFAKGTTYWVKLPRYIPGVDPTGEVNGYAYTDTANLYISCNSADIYYYIFVDPV